MVQQNRDILNNFDLNSIPDLDVCVLGALELFVQTQLPPLNILSTLNMPLVVGSGNAIATGKLVFGDRQAIFADEGTYKPALQIGNAVDGAILLSASGGKHAVEIAQYLQERGIRVHLLTNNPEAPAKQYVEENCVHVFPKNREPYTYNTSTYMGIILGKTREDAKSIYDFIHDDTAKRMPDNLGSFNAFYLLLPERFAAMREMFITKFDELFGPKLVGRVYTAEQTKHAKTVVSSETELFVSFGGEPNEIYGSENARLHIPLPGGSDFGGMMAIGYYVIGRIQKQHPPYFKEHIARYTETASKLFGQSIEPIVD